MSELCCALAQIDTCVGDLASNSAKVLESVRIAASRGAELIIFPEMTLTGYPIEDLALRATFRKAAWNTANELATTLEKEGFGSRHVLVGTIGTDRTNDKPRNRMVDLHEGVVWACYDKHRLPNYGVFDEYRIFSPGAKNVVLDIHGVRVGVAICEDIWQEGDPVDALAKESIDMLVTINGSPYEKGKTSVRQDLALARAKQLHAPVVYVNQVGGQDDLVFDGGSFVIDSDGTVLEESPMFVEHISLFTLNTKENRKKYSQLGTQQGSLRSTDNTQQHLDQNGQLYCACVLGLKDYMAKNHFIGVCLGLSGGIDSALVATMAADACGAEHVVGIAMPSMYSSQSSLQDAQDLASNLGIRLCQEPIGTIFDAMNSQLHLTGIPAENLQARIRGIIVMSYSNAQRLLALATGNKSELAVGYSTIYGDAVGGYGPIKDLLKTQVWDLARWRNTAYAQGIGIGMLPIVGSQLRSDDNATKYESSANDHTNRQISISLEKSLTLPQVDSKTLPSSVLIPVNSIEKPPSAELAPGQLDSDSLPPYELLDKVLEAYIERAQGRADLLEQGFDAATVDVVMRLVDQAEWKRRQYPLGPKVSALAFGRDRRLPVTSAFRE